MYEKLETTIRSIIANQAISRQRQKILQPLIEFVQTRLDNKQVIAIQFICTHNSRRSHFAQIWAQVASAYFNIPNVHCYSGGTDTTALFPVVAQTLADAGLNVHVIATGDNPIYAIKYAPHDHPVIGFSKKYDHVFNPASGFAAVMTCSQADEGCPFILGADSRIPITYEDPKAYDNTPIQEEKYRERSLQIASEMFFVFSQITHDDVSE